MDKYRISLAVRQLKITRIVQRVRVDLSACLVCAFGMCSGVVSADPMTLEYAIERAATSNPGVRAAWNKLEASREGVRAAKGGYLPKLDFEGVVGQEQTEDPLDVSSSYDTSSYRFTMTQMLFDGFATRQEVAKQRYTQFATYYEFRQVAEEVALETAQAYLDVLRYRELVSLADESYQSHLRYHKDIKDRVTSGLGRGVDLNQAEARLALAKSNVLTETSNLHDVTNRFYRLVGEFPSDQMQYPDFKTELIPEKREDALLDAYLENPQLNATIEMIRAANADLKGRNAPMMPRLDLRLRKELDENYQGSVGDYDEQAVELVVSYNLYRGGSDSARKRQAKYLKWEAEDTRERVCREVRQTVSIAHNDVRTKTQLLDFLNSNAESIAKARDAYKKQFDIGQRTLLDLLDTENEYFEVKRSLTNAKSEIKLAQLRTLAGMGRLLQSMNAVSFDRDMIGDVDKNRDSREVSLAAKCPVDTPLMPKLNFAKKAPKKQKGPLLSDNDLMKLDVKFKPQSAVLTHDVGAEITKAAKFLCANAGVEVIVEGHTDSQGAASYNQTLSQARAESVRDAIVMECDSARGRISAKGYGEARPISTNETALGRATNRRVELRIRWVNKAQKQSSNTQAESLEKPALLDLKIEAPKPLSKT